ncbi:uncharacterized protein LOC116308611 isoform X2 [Actinia tenebrosa]|uniref:CCR4-NOT transcription complex subunit 4 n=1 Tax=Actinia tenebrosa TaxID=6105 RepID=A0A6P8JB41_ACTTE|nr:uncharacterized protein LOC116308611 isoform X2 [Actinia tenebrosa]
MYKMQTTELDCPLCMEPLEIDDVNFYPCTCGYQVCRFCWHRIRTDENGLCPACRKAYSEDPAVYTPLSQDEIQRIIKERKQKDTQRKQKLTENRKHLANVRVVQKNLVFVVGLTQRLADSELLKRNEYFGKFGKIHKIVINNSTNYAGPQGPSASAYITYNKEEDAYKAILAVSNAYLDGRTLKASLGTTKYCSYFLRNIPCPKQDCMYLHELGDEVASFTKEEMQEAKHQEYEQQLLANYARKMGINTDKISKDLWSGTEGSSLPSGSGWGIRDDASGSSHSGSPHPRASPPGFENYDQKDNDTNYWDEENWDTPNQPTVPQPKENQPITDTETEKQTTLNTKKTIPTQTKIPQKTQNIIKTIPPAVQPTLPQSIPKNVGQPRREGFDDTGWPVSAAPQVPPVTDPLLDYTPTVSTNLFDGTSGEFACGLGLSNLHLKVSSDDDLGFDPWNESSKGLADLLREEVTQTSPTSFNPHQPIPPSTNRPGYVPQMNQQQIHGHTNADNKDDFKSWQEGFRALLPNININFSGWPNTEGYQRGPSEWSPATQDTSNIPTTTTTQRQVRPPPGFEAKRPDPHIPMVDDPSIVWSKVIGGKSDPLPIVPGIITNGYSGLSSGNGPTDLPGAVAVQSPGMLKKYHQPIPSNIPGIPGQPTKTSSSQISNTTTMPNDHIDPSVLKFLNFFGSANKVKSPSSGLSDITIDGPLNGLPVDAFENKITDLVKGSDAKPKEEDKTGISGKVPLEKETKMSKNPPGKSKAGTSLKKQPSTQAPGKIPVHSDCKGNKYQPGKQRKENRYGVVKNKTKVENL